MESRIPRREFMEATGRAAAFATLGGAAASARIIGANDRIRIGIIGVGGHGGGNHLKWLHSRTEENNLQVGAVADVFRKRVTRAQSVVPGCAGYLDYRKLLENKDIDAVVIATPDHWHARISIDAMEAGKHVYCEKPMTLTVEQAIAVRNTARKTKVAYTVGPQRTGDAAFWEANNVITEGRIGKVMWAQSGGGSSQKVSIYDGWFKVDPDADPSGSGENYIDWDMWLGWQFGLAPKIPWNPQHYFRFRKYWPYSGGQASDLLYHTLAPLLLAIAGPNGAYPTRVTASGGLYQFREFDRDVPDVYVTTLDYAGEYTILLVNHSAVGARIPTLICGRHGALEMTNTRTPRGRPHEPTSDLRLRAEPDFLAEFKEKNENSEAQADLKVEPRRDIMARFLDAIRGLGTVSCNAELGAATMVGIRMGVDAYRLNKPMIWDPRTETVVS
jgi:predicted dehydrogenase